MKKSLLWLSLALLAVGGGVVYETPGSKGSDATPAPSVLVNVIRLVPGTLPAVVSGDGSVMAGPGASVTLSALASGVVNTLDVVPGQAVTAGQLLLSVGPDAQSIADYAKAKSALAAAQANQAHVSALLAGHLATTADLALANQGVQDAASTLAALNATGSGRVRRILAPVGGIVAAVQVAPGAVLTPGMALLQIAKADGLVAGVGIAPAQAAGIAVGDQVSMQLLETGATATGSVVQIGRMTDAQTGLIDVTVSFGGGTMPQLGDPVQAAITTGTLNGYVVPRDCVQSDEQGTYVFQVDSKNVAHREAVNVLGNLDDKTIIAASISPEMPLVTTGAYQLDDGVPVRLANSGAGN